MEKVMTNSKSIGHSTEIIWQSKIKRPLLWWQGPSLQQLRNERLRRLLRLLFDMIEKEVGTEKRNGIFRVVLVSRITSKSLHDIDQRKWNWDVNLKIPEKDNDGTLLNENSKQIKFRTWCLTFDLLNRKFAFSRFFNYFL